MVKKLLSGLVVMTMLLVLGPAPAGAEWTDHDDYPSLPCSEMTHLGDFTVTEGGGYTTAWRCQQDPSTGKIGWVPIGESITDPLNPQSKYYDEQRLSVGTTVQVQEDALGNKAVVAQASANAYKTNGQPKVIPAGDLEISLYIEKRFINSDTGAAYWEACSQGYNRTAQVDASTMFVTGALRQPDDNSTNTCLFDENLTGKYRAVAQAGFRSGGPYTTELRSSSVTAFGPDDGTLLVATDGFTRPNGPLGNAEFPNRAWQGTTGHSMPVIEGSAMLRTPAQSFNAQAFLNLAGSLSDDDFKMTANIYLDEELIVKGVPGDSAYISVTQVEVGNNVYLRVTYRHADGTLGQYQQLTDGGERMHVERYQGKLYAGVDYRHEFVVEPAKPLAPTGDLFGAKFFGDGYVDNFEVRDLPPF